MITYREKKGNAQLQGPARTYVRRKKKNIRSCTLLSPTVYRHTHTHTATYGTSIHAPAIFYILAIITFISCKGTFAHLICIALFSFFIFYYFASADNWGEGGGWKTLYAVAAIIPTSPSPFFFSEARL